MMLLLISLRKNWGLNNYKFEMSRLYQNEFIVHIERCEYCQQVEEEETDKDIIFEKQDMCFKETMQI